MPPATIIDVNTVIDRPTLCRLQKLVLFLGFCIITLEGFDMALLGFIIPVLKQQWQVGAHALGYALAAAQLGLVLGSVAAGPLADRFGRKPVLLASILVFGSCTILTALSESLPWLILFRLFTGIGVGSVVPNAATLISEFMPPRLRSRAVGFIICGVAFSSACAGFVSAWIIPLHGWRILLIVGGVVPLLILPLLMMVLPESLRFLVARPGNAARMRTIVERMSGASLPAQSVFVSAQQQEQEQLDGSGLAQQDKVLSPRYRFGSLMLWLAYFAALFASNMLSHWLPTLVKESGYSLQYAARTAAIYQTGGVIGALAIGWAMDRLDQHKIPALACLLSSALFLGLGLAFHSPVWMPVQAFALGFCLIGSICSINALPTSYYPTAVRATGSCWMHGAGRCGALLAIFAGAQLIGMQWSADQVFILLVLPALVTAMALAAKHKASTGRPTRQLARQR